MLLCVCQDAVSKALPCLLSFSHGGVRAGIPPPPDFTSPHCGGNTGWPGGVPEAVTGRGGTSLPDDPWPTPGPSVPQSSGGGHLPPVARGGAAHLRLHVRIVVHLRSRQAIFWQGTYPTPAHQMTSRMRPPRSKGCWRCRTCSSSAGIASSRLRHCCCRSASSASSGACCCRSASSASSGIVLQRNVMPRNVQHNELMMPE